MKKDIKIEVRGNKPCMNCPALERSHRWTDGKVEGKRELHMGERGVC
jgi:hypothetical protein